MGVIEDYKIESWTLYACGCLVIFFRLFARWRVVGFQNFCLDDYLMLLALLFDTSLNVLAHFMMKVGVTNSKLDMATRAALTQEEMDLRATGSKIWMSGWCTYSATVWTLKFCMIIFFNRVMKSLHRQRLITYAFWITGISGVCVYSVFWFSCLPTYKLFQSYPYPGKNCEAETPVFYVSTLVFNLATDLYIICIPFPVLWNARIPLQRKLMMLLLFGGGFFVIIAAILRCVLGLTSPVATTTAQWACRETFVAIVIGNAPMIKPLFSRNSWSVSTGRSKPTEDESGHNATEGSTLEMSKRSQKSKKGKTLMSITGDTVFASDSQEQIVDAAGEMGQHAMAGHGGSRGSIYTSSGNSGHSEHRLSQEHRGLQIVADTTYSISSTPAADLDLEQGFQRSGSGGSSPPGRLRPEKDGYTVMIEGKGF